MQSMSETAYRKLEIEKGMDIKIHVIDPKIEIVCDQAAGLQNLAHLTCDLTCPAECHRIFRQDTDVIFARVASNNQTFPFCNVQLQVDGAAFRLFDICNYISSNIKELRSLVYLHVHYTEQSQGWSKIF